MIRHTRRQHPVGQGFFHSAKITSRGKTVSYVYDCGSTTRYKDARKREVAAYLGSLGSRKRLDFLFISHAHEDHVSGIEQLLDTANGGVQVDTIVMPFMDVYDRLICFLTALFTDTAAAREGFYKDFVVDPVSALRRFKPRQIIIVRPGEKRDEEESAPEPLLPDGEIPTKLTGYGFVTRDDTTDSGLVLVVPDTRTIEVGNETVTWKLAPYVDASVNARRIEFKHELAMQLGMSPRRLGQILRWSGNRAHLLRCEKIEALVSAYKRATPDLNVTSMCLWSGPVNSTGRLEGWHEWKAGDFSGHAALEPVAWLGTGDAALGAAKRRTSMLEHYQTLLPDVVTLTLPHHGATGNFHPDLLVQAGPRYCVAAADFMRQSWRHPGSEVVEWVASHNALLFTVNSEASSRLHEVVVVC